MTRTREVLVVDDHRSFADLLALAVDAHEGLRSAGVETCLTGLAGRLRSAAVIDTAVVDVRLGAEDGLDAVRMLRAARPEAAVVLLTGFARPGLIDAARTMGASAVVDKRAPLHQVLPAIAAARSRGFTVYGGAVRTATSEAAEPTRTTAPHVRLTGREQQVLSSLADGRALRDTAEALGITVNTCRGYVQQVLEKLGAHSRLEAVAVARRTGLIDDPPG